MCFTPYADRSFELPLAGISVGVISLHVLMEAQDSMLPVQHLLVHAAHLLAFPPDAAAEVADMFGRFTREVAHFFTAAGTASLGLAAAMQLGSHWAKGAASCGGLQHSSASSAAWAQGYAQGFITAIQQQQSGTWPDPAACYAYDYFLLPFVRSWVEVERYSSGGCAGGPALQQQQLEAGPQMHGAPSNAAELLPDGAALPGASTAARPHGAQAATTCGCLMDYMLDHELFSCVVLMMNRHPALTQAALADGPQAQEQECMPQLLAALNRAAYGSGCGTPCSRGGGSCGDDESSDEDGEALLRQLCELQNGRQAAAAGTAAAAAEPAVAAAAGVTDGCGGYNTPRPLRSPPPLTPQPSLCPPMSPMAAAMAWAEGLPRTERQLQLQADLEKLDMLFTGELTLTHIWGKASSSLALGAQAAVGWPRGQQQQQLEEQRSQAAGASNKACDAKDDAGAWYRQPAQVFDATPPRPQPPLAPRVGGRVGQPAPSRIALRPAGSSLLGQLQQQLAPGRPLGPRPESPRARTGACAATKAAGSSQGDGAVQAPFAGHMAAQLQPTFGVLLRSTIWGFPTASVESFYVVFKSHFSNLVDTTALLYSFCTWVTTVTKSLHAPAEVATLLLYLLLFFVPYAVMLTNRTAFLRNREWLLTMGRCLGAVVIGCCCLSLTTCVPAAWRVASASPIVVLISHAVIVPACQQVRLRFTIPIFAAHLFGDFGLLSTGMATRHALALSALIQVVAVVLTAALDACTRRTFLLRYQGALRSSGGGSGCEADAGAAGGGGGRADVRRCVKVE